MTVRARILIAAAAFVTVAGLGFLLGYTEGWDRA